MASKKKDSARISMDSETFIELQSHMLTDDDTLSPHESSRDGGVQMLPQTESSETSKHHHSAIKIISDEDLTDILSPSSTRTLQQGRNRTASNSFQKKKAGGSQRKSALSTFSGGRERSNLFSTRTNMTSPFTFDDVVEEDWLKKLDAAHELYNEVANTPGGKYIGIHDQSRCRSPYQTEKLMGRGADYFDDFRGFIEGGGIGKYKKSVVVNVRVNGIYGLDMLEGKFKVSYYLDMAFWVPIFDSEFYSSEDTLGCFAAFEPQINFPDALESNFIGRDVEFSKNPGSRQHEIQIGQNREWTVKLSPKNGYLNDKYEKQLDKKKKVCSVDVETSHKYSHWPRLYRVLMKHDEVSSLNQESSDDWFGLSARRLRNFIGDLDHQRAKDLSHESEGIIFMTHDIDAVCLEHFELEDFPYDSQALSIKLRLDKVVGDPMHRDLIPLCSDKGFFCTSRVAPLVEWSIAKNLDWIVEHGVSGNRTRDGGKQRLVARILVVRKSYYYSLHYIAIAFSITTIVFSAFLARPTALDVRSSTVLTVLLTVIAFNYVCQDKIPNVPYATILDTFLIANHVLILLVGIVIVLSNYCFDYGDSSIPRLLGGYHSGQESLVGGLLFIVWMIYNFVFVASIYYKTNKIWNAIEYDEQLGFLDFKHVTVNTSDHTLSSLTGKHPKRTRALKAFEAFEKQRKKQSEKVAQVRAFAHKLDTLSQVAMARDNDGVFMYQVSEG